MVDVRDELATESADAFEGTGADEVAGDESGHEPDGIFAGVLASYGERGYERGYRRAVSDALAALLLATEEYLRQHPHDRPLRAVLYPFEEYVERALHRLGSGDSGFVADGLGI